MLELMTDGTMPSEGFSRMRPPFESLGPLGHSRQKCVHCKHFRLPFCRSDEFLSCLFAVYRGNIAIIG
jgi:hypothetical protein